MHEACSSSFYLPDDYEYYSVLLSLILITRQATTAQLQYNLVNRGNNLGDGRLAPPRRLL